MLKYKELLTKYVYQNVSKMYTLNSIHFTFAKLKLEKLNSRIYPIFPIGKLC
jgi:hypothetical protein